MVSPLWKAAADGDIERVQELLKEASSVDVEIKDHTGATPLIQAIRNGHGEVVNALLAHGADPNNGSAQGRPDTYTQDPEILDALAASRARLGTSTSSSSPGDVSPPTTGAYNGGYGEQPTYDPYAQAYAEGMQFAYPPYPYMYRPDMMPTPPPPPPHFQQQQQQQQVQSPQHRPENGDGSNLPPVDVARTIPCRYYPACRYGASCMFLHPDMNPSPTYAYPLPPVPYPYASPPYDPTTMPYPPYYAMPPPGGYPPMAPIASPPFPPHVGHHRSSSDMHSPVSATFSPPSNPAVGPMWPRSPVSPTYSTHAPVSPIDVSHSVTHSPQNHLPPISPTAYYSPNADVAPPTAPAAHRRSFSTSRGHYGQAPVEDMPDGMPDGPDGYITPYFRGAGRGRGGRRSSFIPNGRQPPSNVPCLFFPSGKCKNGDTCRFAHVMPGPDDPVQPSYPYPRSHRVRASMSYADPNQPPSFPSISEPHGAPYANGHVYPRNPFQPNGFHPVAGAGIDRLRPEKGNLSGVQTSGSSRASSAGPPMSRQRVPSADEFPALGGPGAPNGPASKQSHGPTAAQVLQAPAPRSVSKARSQSGSSSGKMPGNDDVQEIARKLDGITIVDGLPTPPASNLARAPSPALESAPVLA